MYPQKYATLKNCARKIHATLLVRSLFYCGQDIIEIWSNICQEMKKLTFE